MKTNSALVQSDGTFNRKFGLVTYGSLLLLVIIFTFLHHGRPQVLNVPSNSDVSQWRNPTFEQTNIYDRMTPAERSKIKASGLTAMGVDLWLDPVSTSPEFMMWLWAKGDLIRILGINHSNFVGWFLLIFLFALLWESLPPMAARWGRFKASMAFLAIVLMADVFMLVLLILHNTYLVWYALKWLGISQLQIPPGW